MKFFPLRALKLSLTCSLIINLPHVYANQCVPEVQGPPRTIFTDSAVENTQNEQIAAKICEIILSRALRKDIDAEGCNIHPSTKDQYGISKLKENILYLIKSSKPLIFTLVGFPFKSGNTEKNVIGVLPDQAERMALKNLNEFMDAISKIYRPGANLQIYTDGLAFFDLLGIPVENVLAYEEGLKCLASDLLSISIITIQDLFPKQSLKDIQNYIKDQMPSTKELPATEKEVLGRRLLKELDYPSGKIVLKERSLEKLTEEMHRRSQQINHIYKNKFPKSIHLSVHYQKDLGKKVGISLIPGLLTPWHGVAVLNKDGSFVMKRKQEVNKMHQLSLVAVNGISCYFYLVK